MGLDTTHGCWSGAYSSFMRWRSCLHGVLSGSPTNDPMAARKALIEAWCQGIYDDQSVPINVLMNHSDCDGEIPANMCGGIADALQALLPQIVDPPDTFDYLNDKTTEFIKGLRAAADAGEDVEFC